MNCRLTPETHIGHLQSRVSHVRLSPRGHRAWRDGLRPEGFRIITKVCGSVDEGSCRFRRFDEMANGRCDWCVANIGTVPIVDPDGQELWICDWCDEERKREQMCLKH